jgi:hypothetical protein
MALSEDFRAYLLAETPIAQAFGTNVHVNSVPEEITPPYIWLRRSGANHERTLGQGKGEQAFEERWDLEVISDDPSEIEGLAKLIRDLDSDKGTFGTGTIQGLFVEDYSDEYIPKGVFSDEGLDVCAFQIVIFGYVPGGD